MICDGSRNGEKRVPSPLQVAVRLGCPARQSPGKVPDEEAEFIARSIG